MENKFTVEPLYAGERADVYLAAKTALSRSHIKKLCDDGKVFLNGREIKSNKTLKAGDEVFFISQPPENLDAEPENIPLDIVYQDAISP